MGELSRIEALRREGLMKNGSEPRLGQIAGALVLKEEELARLLQAAQGTLSLDGPVGDRADAEPFGARLEDRSVARPEEVLAGASLHEELDWALARLSDREDCILRDRFGLAGRDASRCWKPAGSNRPQQGSACGRSRRRPRARSAFPALSSSSERITRIEGRRGKNENRGTCMPRSIGNGATCRGGSSRSGWPPRVQRSTSSTSGTPGRRSCRRPTCTCSARRGASASPSEACAAS